MRQAATQIRKWFGYGDAALGWMRAHAGVVIGAVIVLSAAIWVVEHDTHLRREIELGDLRRELASDVSALRRKAEGALHESRANEAAIRDLESRRAALERDAAALRARLQFLREEERVGVRLAATPGHKMLAGRAESQPGPARRPWGDPAARDTNSSARASGKAQSEISALRFQPNASNAARDFPDRNSGLASAAPGMTSEGERALPAQEAPETSHSWMEGRSAGKEGPIQISNSGFQQKSPDACGEQLVVQDQLIANCEERAEVSRAALEAAKRSALDLREALQAKDAIAARIEERQRAELKAARGSRLRKFGRALQYLGAGVVIGMIAAR